MKELTLHDVIMWTSVLVLIGWMSIWWEDRQYIARRFKKIARKFYADQEFYFRYDVFHKGYEHVEKG